VRLVRARVLTIPRRIRSPPGRGVLFSSVIAAARAKTRLKADVRTRAGRQHVFGRDRRSGAEARVVGASRRRIETLSADEKARRSATPGSAASSRPASTCGLVVHHPRGSTAAYHLGGMRPALRPEISKHIHRGSGRTLVRDVGPSGATLVTWSSVAYSYGTGTR